MNTAAFVILVWVVNFGISIWNAYAVGKAWVETKYSGGWPRFVAWAQQEATRQHDTHPSAPDAAHSERTATPLSPKQFPDG